MVKRAADGLIVRYGEGAAKLEGANLTKFITVLNEYLTFFDKVDKRLRDEKVADLLPKLDLSKRADFEGDKKSAPKKIEKLERELKKIQKERQFKEVESRFDEEHNLWEARYVNSQGAEHLINWELASRRLSSRRLQNPRRPAAMAKSSATPSAKTSKKPRRRPPKLCLRNDPPSRRSSRRPLPVSCSITFSLKARKISAFNATKAWAK